MQSKFSLKWSLLIISIIGIALSLIIIFFNFNLPGLAFYVKPVLPIRSAEVSAQQINSQAPKNPVDNKSVKVVPNIASPEQASLSDRQAVPGLPIRLNIPKINVNTTIEQVDLTPQGAVDVPKGPVNAAWFKLWPRPGENGSAIIVGHYGRWKNGTPTVFNNLYKLRKGDKIYVKDKKGATITFVVRKLKTYVKNDDASDVFISSDGKAHLNLITCEGIWDKVSKSYSKRLVVFTDQETK